MLRRCWLNILADIRMPCAQAVVPGRLLVRSTNRARGTALPPPNITSYGVEDAGKVGSTGWRAMSIKDNQGWESKMEALKRDGE